jgi:phosphoenolpyruvate synthase/pyruvate phosphate dikinase
MQTQIFPKTFNSNLFSSKAQVLKTLEEFGFNVPKVYFFSIEAWQKNQPVHIKKILDTYSDHSEIIVRSSSLKEDQTTSSLAGAFESVLNVKLTAETIIESVNQVIYSYSKPSPLDEILIQPMLTSIELSGVLMTRSLEDGSPYYVINYDDESGRTDTVTGGVNASKTVYIYRNAFSNDFDSARIKAIIQEIKPIEDFFESDSLDIEFALDQSLNINILQVRPITNKKNWHSNCDFLINEKLEHLESFLNNAMLPRSNVFGDKTIFGVMPDWNPAEIIGISPRPISASLYRYIVTTSIWSQARTLMGYNQVPNEELMILLANRPYIDVRNSFNSLIPKDLPDNISEKLINAFLQRLDQHPEFHDKVEFEIIPTLLDFNFDAFFSEAYPNLLSPKELKIYKAKLQTLTLDCLKPSGTIKWATQRIEELRTKQELNKKTSHNKLDQVKNLLDECKEYGTLPFAILARHAFMAESLLRSAVTCQALTMDRYNQFKASIQTISSEIGSDHLKVCKKEMSPANFLKKYGHLRPGTYDILSDCYHNKKEFLFSSNTNDFSPQATSFVPTDSEIEQIATLLAKSEFEKITVKQFFEYCENAIKMREYAKFVFSRSLSDAIEVLASWGEEHKINRDDLSWLNVNVLLKTIHTPLLQNTENYFKKLIRLEKEQYEIGKNIKLSYLIRSPRDIYVVPQHRSTPNFVTQKKCQAQVVHLSNSSKNTNNLEGKIVCIEQADPGFDWLFTKNIAALITQYGGTNSHMTIRCSEYGIPAAIGVGEKLFQTICQAKYCEIDSESKTLREVFI